MRGVCLYSTHLVGLAVLFLSCYVTVKWYCERWEVLVEELIFTEAYQMACRSVNLKILELFLRKMYTSDISFLEAQMVLDNLMEFSPQIN
ncbi:hypothetical protein TNIN_344371 [Trichonephila inaurata madagascariensis]|uniref:Uncharacterized protein n=1 Tax=Trichonephila inaurata madagascariensis TaxID=2747483 RepID=A0A8X6WTY5_9ARAC|nr:hypothetical protein TNIN_344371 [Trichonephila inaurata madagascariensis]